MHIELTIRNYRCFPDSYPLRFEIKDGFTAFIGVNNSGKSSILRFFYEFRNLFSIISDASNLMNLLRGGCNAFVPSQSVKDPKELFSNGNDRELLLEFRFPETKPPANPAVDSICFSVTRDCIVRLKNFVSNGAHYGPVPTSSFVNADARIIQVFAPSLVTDFGPFSRMMSMLTEMFYIGAFRNAVNVGTKDQYFDIPIGQSFIKSWRNYKTGSVKRQNELIKQVTRDIGSIFDLDLEINPTPDDETLQIFVGESSFKLNELGAGLAQFIVVLGAAAIRSPQFILIDEPELNLHPSLQVSFLTTLASYSKNGVLFSTHSIGLARSVGDRVYAIRRIKQGESDIGPLEGVPRYAEFLGELSFNGYQELGFDRVLLVEGSTEVRTIQQFLRQLKIDHQVVLLPLGGAGMINGAREQELTEIKRISKNVYALIDSEKSSASDPLHKQREEFAAACNRAGISCHILHRHAIENYFADAAIKTEKGEKYRALGHFEKLESVNPHWAKSENWRIARRMDVSELKDTDLLCFLQELMTSVAAAH